MPKLDSASDIQNAIKTLGLSQAGELVRKEALEGNLVCQIFMSAVSLQYNDEKNAEIFTKMAAEAGHTKSQANLAILYLKKVDRHAEYFSEQDIFLIKSAKYWHRKAAAHGFLPSIAALKDLEVFPDSQF